MQNCVSVSVHDPLALPLLKFQSLSSHPGIGPSLFHRNDATYQPSLRFPNVHDVSSCLYVFNIRVSQADLVTIFSPFGILDYIWLRNANEAFVNYKSYECATRAMVELNGGQLNGVRNLLEYYHPIVNEAMQRNPSRALCNLIIIKRCRIFIPMPPNVISMLSSSNSAPWNRSEFW